MAHDSVRIKQELETLSQQFAERFSNFGNYVKSLPDDSPDLIALANAFTTRTWKTDEGEHVVLKSLAQRVGDAPEPNGQQWFANYTASLSVEVKRRRALGPNIFLISAIAAAPLAFGIWSLLPRPQWFQIWTDINLIMQSVGLGIVISRALEAQTSEPVSGELGKRAKVSNLLGLVAIAVWAVAGLVLLAVGGHLTPVHNYIALELSTVLPIFSYLVAKSRGWNRRISLAKGH
jgi:hypothetical protein